jgi:SAM-dependent methyltransferase/transcriptional regulator with XRE-family HTH domain
METQTANNKGLLTRLDECVERVGGKRALATATLISEAQLFRYLGGDSILPIDRLFSIAKAAKVDAGWLLTGDGEPEPTAVNALRPGFRPDLMVKITEVFEEVILEYDKKLTLPKRARILTFMYEAMRHEECLLNIQITPTKAHVIAMLDTLGKQTFDEVFDIHEQAYKHLVLQSPLPDGVEPEYWYQQFTNAVQVGWLNTYTGLTGEQYFRRLGTQIVPRAAARLTELMQDVRKLLGPQTLRWLDVGCGNGRELSFLLKHFEGLKVAGIDASPVATDLASQLLAHEPGLLEPVRQGDMRKLPWDDASFDVVYNRMSLFTLPFFENNRDVGLHALFEEFARVLRHGGVFYLMTRYGHGFEIFPFEQLLNENDIKLLAKLHGFTVENIVHIQPPAGTLLTNVKYEDNLMAILRKK